MITVTDTKKGNGKYYRNHETEKSAIVFYRRNSNNWQVSTTELSSQGSASIDRRYKFTNKLEAHRFAEKFVKN